jgi:hypothetical protein
VQTGAATISSKQLLNCIHEAEWSPFQTHYFSENLVAPGIKPGTSGSVASKGHQRERLQLGISEYGFKIPKKLRHFFLAYFVRNYDL